MEPPKRRARLVLQADDGQIIGCLDPVDVATPWWQDIAPVIRAVRDKYNLNVTVLRLLEAEFDCPPGGLVTYLAQPDGQTAATKWHGQLNHDPQRASWANLAAPAADVAWAMDMLAAKNITVSGKAEQIRTWNLSSLWRIPTSEGWMWLKHVPTFAAKEGAVLQCLADEAVPQLVAIDGRRILMREVAGEDLYHADLTTQLAMVDMLVSLQVRWADKTAQLLTAEVADWRRNNAMSMIRSVISRRKHHFDPQDCHLLETFSVDLESRYNALEQCGIPESLVHGDCHPGNFRGSHPSSNIPLTLLDFADSAVGHPLLDMPAFLDRVDIENRDHIRHHWFSRWRQARPASSPERAEVLIAPIATAKAAANYQYFLDSIEPSEYKYHLNDPEDWLGRTVKLLRDSA